MGKSIKISTSSWLEERLKTIRKQLIAGFFCFAVVALCLTEISFYFQRKSAAELILKTIHQPLLAQDQRTVIMLLNSSAFPNFLEVKVTDYIGGLTYSVEESKKSTGFFRTFVLFVPFSTLNPGSGAAKLEFSYPLFLGKWLSISLIIVYGILAFFFYVQAAKNLRLRWDSSLVQENARATEMLASQVSHDIRSPLAALNMIVGTLDALPEEKRQIIRSATQRINDIANQLLQKGNAAKSVSGEKPTSSLEPVMLVSILDSIISEKRVQYREKMQVQIQAELSQGYGLFSLIDSSEFARVISNLINNSVEAFSGEGQITLSLKADSSSAVIAICDNGKGIPSEVLARLGEQGVTHGKEGTQSGSGLGVYHARQMIEAAGGKFQIESTLGVGTTITLTLPRTEEPWWFLRQLRVTPGQKIISFDDDQTIHQIWNGRIKSSIPPNAKVEHLSFSSSAQLEEWVHSNKDSVNSFLVDFEILGQKENGLDVIERLGIGKQSVLVTSRFDEHNVRNRAKILGVKILPKGLAPSVPFQIEAPREKYAAVVIDDDPLVHQMWEMVAKARQHKLVCFSRPEDFFAVSSQVNLASPIFIDVSLGDGIRGEKIAEQVAALGFTDISLSTGYAPGSIQAPACVKRIVGKEPIF